MDKRNLWGNDEEISATISKKAKMDNDSMIGEETANIGLLPDEILIKILSLVPMAQWSRLEIVNKIFQRNIYDLWKTVRRIRFNDDLKIIRLENLSHFYGVLKKLINRAPNIQFLGGFKIFRYADCSTMITDDFLHLITQFLNLKSVSFDNFYLAMDELTRFLETPTIRDRLRELEIIDCLKYRKDDEILKRIFGENSDLTPLRLESFRFSPENYPFKFLQAIDTSRLTTLNIRHFTKDMASLISRCSRLERLECTFIRDIWHPYNDDYYKLFDAISTRENLLSLTLQSDSLYLFVARCCQNLPRWIGLFGRLRHLIEFSLSNTNIDEVIIKAIADNLDHLRSLKLNVNCGWNEGLTYLATRMNRLKKLELEITSNQEMHEVYSYDFFSVMEANMNDLELLRINFKHSDCYGHLIYWPRIKKLNMRLTKIMHREWYDVYAALTQMLMDKLGSTLESLEFLNEEKRVNYCLISLLRKAPYLRRLKLKVIGDKADYALKSIAIYKLAPNLEELDVEHHQVTTLGMQAIIDACPKLKRVRGFYQMEALDFERKSED